MKKILSVAGLFLSIPLTGMEPAPKVSKEVLNQRLGQAILKNDMAGIRSLLEQGADPAVTSHLLCYVLQKNIAFSPGQETLQHEYEENRNQVVALLIKDKRTNLNCKNLNGETPLITLARLDNRVVAEKLLKSGGVEVNAKNNRGETAVDVAKSEEMRILLKKYGADNESVEPAFPRAAAQPTAGQRYKQAEPISAFISEFDVSSLLVASHKKRKKIF